MPLRTDLGLRQRPDLTCKEGTEKETGDCERQEVVGEDEAQYRQRGHWWGGDRVRSCLSSYLQESLALIHTSKLNEIMEGVHSTRSDLIKVSAESTIVLYLVRKIVGNDRSSPPQARYPFPCHCVGLSAYPCRLFRSKSFHILCTSKKYSSI